MAFAMDISMGFTMHIILTFDSMGFAMLTSMGFAMPSWHSWCTMYTEHFSSLYLSTVSKWLHHCCSHPPPLPHPPFRSVLPYNLQFAQISASPTKFHWPRSKIKGTLFIVWIFKVHDLLDCVELENIHKLWKLSPPQAQHLPSLQADSLNRGWRVSKSRHQDLLTKLENPHETRGGAKRDGENPRV